MLHSLRQISRRISVDTLVTIAGLLGLMIFLSLYSSAFPSAALKMTRSRSEITQLARAYMTSRGYHLDGYQFALTFESASFGSIFLQRTLGIAETNQLIEQNNLPFWYWQARWYRPMQQEEFSVSLLTDGTISGFSHTIAETDAGAALKQADAQAKAEAYLAEQGWDLAGWDLVTASSADRPARRDHTFSWRRNDFNIGNAEIRLKVSIQGDSVGTFDYWFKVPEEFSRKYSSDRNLPNFISGLSYEIGLVGFSVIAILFLIFPLLQRLNPLRGILPLSLLVTAVSLLSSLNYLPLYKAWYSTTQDWGLFWVQAWLGILIESVSVFVFVTAILAGGRYISRQVWKREDKILPRGQDRWMILARSGWRGFMLGGVLLAYAVLFYLLATRVLGGWTPVDVDYSNAFATPLPFILPLNSGLLAASQEEILFRLVGVSLVLWLTHKKWLALLIPGTLWAFAHLSYVRDPFYLRGIELLITAVLIEGLFFLYFDLTTTIVAHMTYNALLGALPMLRSSDPYLVVSGVLVILLLLSPVFLGLFRSWRQRRKLASGAAQIRPALLDDLPRITALLDQDGQAPSGLDWPELMRSPCAAVLVLETGGQLSGVAVGEVSPAESGALPYNAKLLAVSILPAWRGQFWGSRLVDALWLRLEELGAGAFQASVPSSSRPAYAFLSMAGWQVTEQVLSRQADTPAGAWFKALSHTLRPKQKEATPWPESSTKSSS